MKKIFLSTLSILTLFLIVFQLNNETTANSKENQSKEMPVINAKSNYKAYKNTEDMEKEADLVVIASPKEKFENRKHVTSYYEMSESEKFVEFFYTLTDVKIKNILYSKETFDEKNKEITIVENVGIFTDNDGIKKKITIEGYEETKHNEDYILYLKRNDQGSYYILNITNGKFNIKDDVIEVKDKEHQKTYEKFKKETKERYKDKL